MDCYNYIIENSEAWLQYAVRLNVRNENKKNLQELRTQVITDVKIKKYLHDITDFHSILVRNHKNPDLPIHKLIFLLDIGLDTDVPEIQAAVKEIMAHKDENGVYQSLTNVPKHFGGSGTDIFSWCLCDAPLLLYGLLKAGIDYEKHIKQGVDYLLNFYEPHGFPCTVSQELGKFRGPGRKADCCPYATLIMLRLLISISEYKDSDMVKESADALLSLWENSLERHPYMFYMGTDFRKLKAPTIWYDIVSVVDVLSQIDSVREDVRFKEMIQLIKNKQDENGFFTPESVYQKYKGWDFGQKKKPSSYLTYRCCLILERQVFKSDKKN
ncbi:hypothetical protein [Candidatus Enterococcus ferrettii]|uniref:Uncharacterized protein n=1 Tax=Candidatus Enterococcus ferrettii TaxID=2815324 RepID=A0ABV0ESD4_9ENTE|nr:hypothetical protein [Enterococcus sp. 665A]MBO1341364.1 hypothetical protein [Enterococcus sp. 665A]